MALGRKVDDESRREHLVSVEDEHFARSNLVALATTSVGLEVFWKRAFELKCDAASHYTDAVDGVDQSFGVFCEDVARLVFDHDIPPLVSVVPPWPDLYRRSVLGACECSLCLLIHLLRQYTNPGNQAPGEPSFNQELSLFPVLVIAPVTGSHGFLIDFVQTLQVTEVVEVRAAGIG